MIEEDSTYEQQFNWYRWAIAVGLIEMIFEKDKLVGFCEWIRLNEIPRDWSDIPHTIPPHFRGAPVLFISNLCAIKKGVMWKLKDRVLAKNKDRKAICWHRKRDDKWCVIRRKHVEEMVTMDA